LGFKKAKNGWSAESWAQDGRQRNSHPRQLYFRDGMRR